MRSDCMRRSTVSSVYETGRSEVVFFPGKLLSKIYRLHENKRITTTVSLTVKNTRFSFGPAGTRSSTANFNRRTHMGKTSVETN